MKHERSYRYDKQKTSHETKKSSQLVAGVAIAAAVSAPMAYGAHHFFSHERAGQAVERVVGTEEQASIRDAAEKIRHKYDACAITSMTDLHTVPPSGDANRTTLRLTLTVDRNAAAAEHLKKYDNSSDYEHKSDVRWTNPELVAWVEAIPGVKQSVRGSGGNLDSYEIPDSDIATDGSRVDDDKSSFTFNIYPLRTEPRDGVEMTFDVYTNAVTDYQQEGESGEVKTYCDGKAVYNASTQSWQFVTE